MFVQSIGNSGNHYQCFQSLRMEGNNVVYDIVKGGINIGKRVYNKQMDTLTFYSKTGNKYIKRLELNGVDIGDVTGIAYDKNGNFLALIDKVKGFFGEFKIKEKFVSDLL